LQRHRHELRWQPYGHRLRPAELCLQQRHQCHRQRHPPGPRIRDGQLRHQNTTLSNNATSGIFYLPPAGSTAAANGVIDHVVVNVGTSGMTFFTSATNGATVIAVSNSIASNTFQGIGADGTQQLSFDNVSATGNNYGIAVVGTLSVLLNRSVVTGNVTGI